MSDRLESVPEISFGTSGLRGPVGGFTPERIAAFVQAFLELMDIRQDGNQVFVAADRRASSPRISADCITAIRAAGWLPVYMGEVPTPALAAFALAHASPAIMVTGSHIPEEFNGLKFYRPDGEMMKQDEAPVRERAAGILANGLAVGAAEDLEPLSSAADAYVQRFTNAFDSEALLGLKIGVYMHSAVGGGALVKILEALGADVIPYGASRTFLAVDTEAIPEATLNAARSEIDRHGLDAVVSTDGDGDRPLVLDEEGRQINGDVLGALTACALGIGTVVTPLTSTSAIELSDWFRMIERTRIGSPYVIEAMRDLSGGGPVAGFEANGGFLLGADLDLPSGRLPALPTRDAVLPIIAVLAEMRRRKIPLSALAAELPPRVMLADRVRNVAKDDSAAFLAALGRSGEERAQMLPELKSPARVDTTDGLRLTLADGRIVHFRASGNAPELRCYVEADSETVSRAMLDALMTRLRSRFNDRVSA